MTKDKAGNFIFKEGKEYKMKAAISPVWLPGETSICQGVSDFEDVLARKGLFCNGNDTRWWVASDQFEEV